MRKAPLVAGFALSFAVVGCIARPGTNDRALAPGAVWTATIVPAGTSTLHGTVTLVRTDPATQTRAIFALAGGQPNGVLPWHVHYGVCGNDRLIVGTPANYPPLVLGGTGNLNAVTQLPIELADRASYVIHLHASPSDIKTVIACSALLPDRAVTTVVDRSR